MGEPEDTQQFFQHSPFNKSPSVTEINQVRKSLLRTSLPSRLQTYTALMVKTKKTVQWSELLPGFGISDSVLCSPIHFPFDFMQVLWTTASGCRPQTCLYGIFGQARSTDKRLAALYSFEKEPDSWVQWLTTIVPVFWMIKGRGDMHTPKGCHYLRNEGTLAADRDSGVKIMRQWQCTRPSHNEDAVRIFFPAKSFWENLTSGPYSGASGIFCFMHLTFCSCKTGTSTC